MSNTSSTFQVSTAWAAAQSDCCCIEIWSWASCSINCCSNNKPVTSIHLLWSLSEKIFPWKIESLLRTFDHIGSSTPLIYWWKRTNKRLCLFYIDLFARSLPSWYRRFTHSKHEHPGDIGTAVWNASHRTRVTYRTIVTAIDLLPSIAAQTSLISFSHQTIGALHTHIVASGYWCWWPE